MVMMVPGFSLDWQLRNRVSICEWLWNAISKSLNLHWINEIHTDAMPLSPYAIWCDVTQTYQLYSRCRLCQHLGPDWYQPVNFEVVDLDMNQIGHVADAINELCFVSMPLIYCSMMVRYNQLYYLQRPDYPWSMRSLNDSQAISIVWYLWYAW